MSSEETIVSDNINDASTEEETQAMPKSSSAVDISKSGSKKISEENIQKKNFSPLKDEKGIGNPIDLSFILDIPLNVSVEIGRTKMMINDLLQLGQGSVIELDKLVGETFDVLVNDKLVARGEVVVVNERFGIRLTDIISPMERVQQLT